MEYGNDGIMGRSGSFQPLNLQQIQHSSIPIFHHSPLCFSKKFFAVREFC